MYTFVGTGETAQEAVYKAQEDFNDLMEVDAFDYKDIRTQLVVNNGLYSFVITVILPQ